MRPNILLITADQWRGDCLGVAGHPVVKTPNVDRLAASGTYFARHYAQTAPCGPARASLYTGLYQMNHRVVRNGTPLDARHDTIALAMRRLGYRSTLFGYTDQAVDPRTVPPDSPWLRTYEGILPGFDLAVGLPEYPEPWLDWLGKRGVAIPKDFRDLYRPLGAAPGRPANAPPRYGVDQTETAFLTDAFLEWLHDRSRSEPWFAHLSYVRPHPPFVVPEPFNTMYDPTDEPRFRRAPTRRDEIAKHPALDYWLDNLDDGFVLGGGPVGGWTDEDFRVVRAVYWGMISEVDRQIGRVMEGLAADGTADNTVIVLTSDHGEMMGDHWALGKFGYFEQAFHVPLIVRAPGLAGSERVDAFTESIDLMPTLIELAGGIPPAHLDGHSLSPLLAGDTPEGWRKAVYWEYDFREVATGRAQAALGLDLDACSLAVYRNRRFKYVHFAGMKPLLFDLDEDPDEVADRAGDGAYTRARLDCAEKLLAWRARHLDRTFTGIELTPDGPVDARNRP